MIGSVFQIVGLYDLFGVFTGGRFIMLFAIGSFREYSVQRLNDRISRFAVILLLVLAFGSVARRAESQDYPLTPDSEANPASPKGEVTYFKFKNSKTFPGTERDCWLYIPKQYDGNRPACVMIFQDGGGFQDNGGGFRVPIVFDNLIAKGEMPVTVGIFISPGVVPATDGNKQLPRYNRSFEYDAVDDRYARFLIEEILPEVSKKVKLTDDPNGRAISGASSGGIASFVAAWERPDYFRRVLSFIGSFTDLRGGQRYGALVRKYEPKPLRVFLQDGSNDQDIYSGNWFIGNNDLSAALQFSGYETRYIIGTRGHDGVQGRAILPDALRWLWKDYPNPIVAGQNSRQPLMRILAPDEPWRSVAIPEDVSLYGSIASDPAGNIYASDTKARLWKIDPDGTATLFATGVSGVSGLAFGADNRLYAAQEKAKRLTAFDDKGKGFAIASGIPCAALTVTHGGMIYAAETKSGRLWRIDASGKKYDTGVAVSGARVLQLTPDQGWLTVAPDPGTGKFASSFRVAADGSLTDGQTYFDIFQGYGSSGTGATGSAVDTEGWLYLATDQGIQVLDQAGRVNGIIAPPTIAGRPLGLAFGGQNRHFLYTIFSGKLYKRNVRSQGVLSCEPALKPPGPRL